jgi:integrase
MSIHVIDLNGWANLSPICAHGFFLSTTKKRCFPILGSKTRRYQKQTPERRAHGYKAGKSICRKSIKNIHTDLAALWAWAIEEEYVDKNIVSTVAAPRVADPVVETFTKEQIEAMLKSCSNNGNWKNGPQACSRFNRCWATRH